MQILKQQLKTGKHFLAKCIFACVSHQVAKRIAPSWSCIITDKTKGKRWISKDKRDKRK
jgi:hypothetical protein